jgi:hypothetical protein
MRGLHLGAYEQRALERSTSRPDMIGCVDGETRELAKRETPTALLRSLLVSAFVVVTVIDHQEPAREAYS